MDHLYRKSRAGMTMSQEADRRAEHEKSLQRTRLRDGPAFHAPLEQSRVAPHQIDGDARCHEKEQQQVDPALPVPGCPRTDEEHDGQDDLEHDKADPRSGVEA